MAVGDAYVFPGFLTPVLTQLSFQSHRLLFSHASAEVRCLNTPERKFASTGDRTRNHRVMSGAAEVRGENTPERKFASTGDRIRNHRVMSRAAEVRGENMPERKFASTGPRTHDHQVMSPTRSPLSHPGGALDERQG